MDPKKNAIEELMKYLDQKDGDELGEAVKPKQPEGIEIAKVKVGDGSDDPSQAPGTDDAKISDSSDASKPGMDGMSDEEISDLIEMLQQKLSS